MSSPHKFMTLSRSIVSEVDMELIPFRTIPPGLLFDNVKPIVISGRSGKKACTEHCFCSTIYRMPDVGLSRKAAGLFSGMWLRRSFLHMTSPRYIPFPNMTRIATFENFASQSQVKSRFGRPPGKPSNHKRECKLRSTETGNASCN